MIRSVTALLVAAGLTGISFAQTPARTAPAASGDKASAYYNFAMGRLYAELAGSEGGRNDYVSKSIQYYLEALKLDPTADVILEELTELYIQSGRLRDAVSQAEDLLSQNPNNLGARRMLGRIYMRMIGDTQQGRINQDMLRRATEQYQKITEQDPKDVESWVILGRLYRVDNRSMDAEKAYNSALKVEPDNEDALTGLAVLYSELGDTQKAIDKLKSVTDKNPSENTLVALASAYEQERDFKSAAEVLKRAADINSSPRIRKALAQDLFYSRQLPEALALYQQLASEDSHDASLPLRMSEIYRAQRNFPAAHKTLDQAKAIDPDNLETAYAEVSLLEAEGKSDDAIASMKKLVDQTSRKTYSRPEAAAHAGLLERLGAMYRDRGQNAEAVDSFRQAAGIDTDNAARYSVEIVQTYTNAKDYDNATKEADSALKKFPNDRMVVMTHASLLAEKGKTDEAITEARGLLKGEKDQDTYLGLARIYDKAKRYNDEAKVLDEAEKAASTDEDKESIDFMRGAMLERSKKYDASEAEFRKVLTLNPNDAGALNYLGYMLANRGLKLDEASRLITKALELEPDNGAYLDSLGWVYYQQGKLQEAEGPLLRAVEKMGEDPTVHDHLGDLYLKMGKTKDAIAQWQTSVQRYHAGAASDYDAEDVAKINKKLENAKVRLAKETK